MSENGLIEIKRRMERKVQYLNKKTQKSVKSESKSRRENKEDNIKSFYRGWKGEGAAKGRSAKRIIINYKLKRNRKQNRKY